MHPWNLRKRHCAVRQSWLDLLQRTVQLVVIACAQAEAAAQDAAEKFKKETSHGRPAPLLLSWQARCDWPCAHGLWQPTTYPYGTESELPFASNSCM